MAAKRDLEAMTGPHGDVSAPPAPSTKRARNIHNASQKKSSKQQSQEAPTDVTYGQRYCFPSVNEVLSHSDEDLDFEDETDALAYLQSVRHEASGIPHLLVASKSGPQLPPVDAYGHEHPDYDDHDPPIDRSIYTVGQGDARGYYHDGAYTAAPSSAPSSPPPPAHDAVDAAYFAALTARFHRLRTTLLHRDAPPPRALLAALPPSHSPHVGPFGPRSQTFARWSARLRDTDPHPAQVAAMDKGAVLRLLRVLLGGTFLRAGAELRERTSRWVWALLARLPERGELDHMEVGHVRELGKRAALLMHTLREMAALRDEVELGGHDGDAGAEEWVGEVDGEAEAAEETEADEPRDTPSHLSADPVRPSGTAPPSVPDGVDDNKVDDDNVEDGEIADESEPMDLESDIESAKARLLANLDNAGRETSPEGGGDGDGQSTSHSAGEAPFDPVRSRMNMRATLSMILTVAGECYGQRDLLEFRDPFHGI